jgi:hypothetical protein
MIRNGSNAYYPVVEDEITWETARKGVPGKLEFSVVKDELINFQEGNAVNFYVNKEKIFYGFVFTKKRNKDQIIKVTAYDQLRYLKNKETYNYTETANGLVEKIAKDFRLQTGKLDNTEYVIANRLEDNKTLFDIIQTALDLTLQNKKEMYVLYDDFGRLTLKNIKDMKLNLVINEETAEDFDYTSSIDSDTYNRIKLIYDDDKTHKREVHTLQDDTNMNSWGLLQYSDTVKERSNIKAKADALLSLYNKKTRNLSISNAIGDIRVRGGSIIAVMLKLGDIDLRKNMLVETVKHTFKGNEHYMDLTLRGGEFIA